MNKRFAAIASLTIAIGVNPIAGSAAERPSATIETWAFAIGSGTLRGDLEQRYADFDLVVVDGEEAGARKIARIGSGGAAVLGYLSVGTIEKWRGWYPQLRRFRLGANKDWKDEWFADVSRRGYRKQVAKIAAGLLAKGFDGLFLDNTDFVEARHYRKLRGAMAKLVAQLEGVAGEGLLFAQNGASVLGRWADHLDGWNREDVVTSYDFGRDRYRVASRSDRRQAKRELRRAARLGLLTLATDYVPRNAKARESRAVRHACGAGALPYVADIDLRRVPADPYRCG